MNPADLAALLALPLGAVLAASFWTRLPKSWSRFLRLGVCSFLVLPVAAVLVYWFLLAVFAAATA